MTKIIFVVSAFLLSLLLPTQISAQIVINEFSSATSSDWVELYNTSTQSAELNSYRLRDETSSNKKDLSGTISGKGFLSFAFGNDLNKEDDTVKLIKLENDNEQTIDQISYGKNNSICAPQENQTIGRSPDGTGSFVRFASATRDYDNTASPVVCASPSPSPSSSPSSSPSPSVSASPTPTLKPTPKPSASVKATPKPSVINSPSPETEDLELMPLPTPLSSPEVLGTKDQKTNFPVGLVFIVLGIIFSGAAGFMAYKQQKTV